MNGDAEALKASRLKNNMSQMAAAVHFEVSISTWIRWETTGPSNLGRRVLEYEKWL